MGKKISCCQGFGEGRGCDGGFEEVFPLARGNSRHGRFAGLRAPPTYGSSLCCLGRRCMAVCRRHSAQRPQEQRQERPRQLTLVMGRASVLGASFKFRPGRSGALSGGRPQVFGVRAGPAACRSSARGSPASWASVRCATGGSVWSWRGRPPARSPHHRAGTPRRCSARPADTPHGMGRRSAPPGGTRRRSGAHAHTINWARRRRGHCPVGSEALRKRSAPVPRPRA